MWKITFIIIFTAVILTAGQGYSSGSANDMIWKCNRISVKSSSLGFSSYIPKECKGVPFRESRPEPEISKEKEEHKGILGAIIRLYKLWN